MVFFLLLTALPVQAARPRILVINSYNKELTWVKNHNLALVEKLSDKADLSFFYMDSKRLSPAEYTAFAEKYWQEFLRRKPDVVVLTDDDALRLLGKRVMDAGTPVVFLGINQNPRVYLGDMKMATGVLERPLYKRSLLYLESLLGEPVKRCLILFDDGTMSKVIMDSAFHNRPSQMLAGFHVDIRLIGRFEDWQEQVRRAGMDGYGIMFVGICHSVFDKDGNHISSEEVMRWTSAHSKVPVFGYWKFSVGKGKMIGGLVHSGQAQGEAAAELVIRVLNGEPPSHIYPVTAKNGDFVFSRHELKRWHIDIPEFFSSEGRIEYVD